MGYRRFLNEAVYSENSDLSWGNRRAGVSRKRAARRWIQVGPDVKWKNDSDSRVRKTQAKPVARIQGMLSAH